MAATKSAPGTAAKNTKSRNRASGGSNSSKNTRKQSTKKTSTANHNNTKKTNRDNLEKVNEYKDRMAFETGVVLIVIIIAAVFMYLSFLGMCGAAGKVVGGFCFGIFGWISWILPAAALAGYIYNITGSSDGRVIHKVLGFSGIMLALSGITDLLSKGKVITEYYADNHDKYHGYLKCLDMTFRDVMAHGKGTGGIIGRWIAGFFKSLLGSVGAGVILVMLLLLFAYLFVGMELMGNIRKRNAYMTEMEDVYDELNDEYDEPSYRMMQPAKRRKTVREAKADVRDMDRHGGVRGYREVQSVDLLKMNERLDKMEQQIAASVAFTETGRRPVLSPDISREAREKLKEEFEKKASDTVKTEKSNTASGNTVKSRVKAKNVEIKNNKADSETEFGTDILDIPIYREEMNRKFGRSHSVQPVGGSVQNKIKADAVTAAEVLSDAAVSAVEEGGIQLNGMSEIDKGTDNVSATGVKHGDVREEILPLNDMRIADSLLKNVSGKEKSINVSEKEADIYIEKSDVHISEGLNKEADNTDDLQEVKSSEFIHEDLKEKDDVYSAKSSIQIPETAENAKEPMASFAPKAGEPDIMPASQKTAMQKNSAAQGNAEMQRNAKVQRNTEVQGNTEMQGNAKMQGNAIMRHETAVSADEGRIVQEMEKKEETVERPYEFPPIELLKMPKEAENGVSDSKLRMTAAKLQSTLKSFNVNVQMGSVTCGPTVTRYELQPEQGVRVNKITNLADDLKLSLAAASIRIEAPIPGKSAVGIEVPNETPSAVYFRELLDGDEFKNSKSSLTFAVGKDIAGKLILTDIAKMPHLLIAGATGSGKSVCINTLIMSILYKADPKDVKIIMIDPKVVELSVYNGIPHLFCPVVTDPKEAAAALNWAVREMMDRYETFKEFGVRNISGYNEKIKDDDNYKKMPFLVIIVDEFADLMMVASKDVEDAVCRLAQLARAAGIHLVLATQRPSVNVITGVIKANIPSRIAFSVSSAIDSRTILDRGGAEKLIGKGDMLFFPSGYSEPVRVQGAFISDKEVSDVVDFLRESSIKPEYNHSVTEIVEEKPKKEKEEQKPEHDEYFAEAGYFVIESERAAAGQLQRRFSIGFNRAGRIIDQLHRAGVIGPAEGTKPRRILMTKEEFSALVGDGAASEVEDEQEDLDQVM